MTWLKGHHDMFETEQQIRQELLEARHEAVSIRDRIADLQWQIEVGEISGEEVFSDRRKAVDKLRHVRKDIKEAELKLLEFKDDSRL